MRSTPRLLIIEPSDIILEGLNTILKETHAFTILSPLHDLSTIEERINVLQPNVLIINPTLTNDKVNINANIPQIALVYQYVEPAILQQFDSVIDIRASRGQIVSIIQEIVGRQKDEERSQEEYELSEREREILILIAKGLSSKEIASNLNISVHTVNTHRKNITHKTGIKSMAGLTVYAMLHNLIHN